MVDATKLTLNTSIRNLLGEGNPGSIDVNVGFEKTNGVTNFRKFFAEAAVYEDTTGSKKEYALETNATEYEEARLEAIEVLIQRERDATDYLHSKGFYSLNGFPPGSTVVTAANLVLRAEQRGETYQLASLVQAAARVSPKSSSSSTEPETLNTAVITATKAAADLLSKKYGIYDLSLFPKGTNVIQARQLIEAGFPVLVRSEIEAATGKTAEQIVTQFKPAINLETYDPYASLNLLFDEGSGSYGKIEKTNLAGAPIFTDPRTNGDTSESATWYRTDNGVDTPLEIGQTPTDLDDPNVQTKLVPNARALEYKDPSLIASQILQREAAAREIVSTEYPNMILDESQSAVRFLLNVAGEPVLTEAESIARTALVTLWLELDDTGTTKTSDEVLALFPSGTSAIDATRYFKLGGRTNSIPPSIGNLERFIRNSAADKLIEAGIYNLKAFPEGISTIDAWEGFRDGIYKANGSSGTASTNSQASAVIENEIMDTSIDLAKFLVDKGVSLQSLVDADIDIVSLVGETRMEITARLKSANVLT